MKIVSIVGTRPNFMKVAPLIKEFEKHNVDHVLIHTGQHYSPQMSHFFIEDLGIKPPKPKDHLVIQTNLSGHWVPQILIILTNLIPIHGFTSLPRMTKALVRAIFM